ncbi:MULTISPECIES: PP2C family protein-serine/threonine phosphatase [unclassified Leptolyngbya]|uniref:GAF domain-containing SpoIIE family protein phosphatase n=1 Tax=unclassified Leptolyngbya TaxID=2650499 RepID=UPI001687EB6B|nr:MULTISPECIES: PP2C family protein-serine/threonine phosphatase [unclassified Leptolyngbya]MBD1910734.1 PP2C family protein-serine/threonine phosphatase [Leptolyngbya sp. FACHB-8]MBD2158169.1 PP2C family protein-serine/threonine phosphatase [Leptolyngbya sp. FACHB-16]
MATAPIPRKSSKSSDAVGSSLSPDMTPVFALKELVSRLHREHNKVQDLLSSLGFALRSFTNLNQFLELTPLIASRVTDADGGALVLYRPNGQMRLERVHCQDGTQCQDVRKALETVTRQLTTTAAGNPGLTKANLTAALDHQISHSLGSGVQLFGTTILTKTVERGRLYVFSYDPTYEWTETRQKLVRLVADQTAVAIANDELTVELRKKERLDRELEIGAEIQHQLLPRQCPRITGIELAARCQTANRVGGDYYDFIPANSDQIRSKKTGFDDCNRWGIAIGDVMGKGVPAGLIMTMLRGMLRAEVLNGHSPSRILQNLNHVMYADLENSNRFVTLFYAEYDTATGRLSYSNAAHNPPLLWQAATQTIQRLDTLGMLIGLDVDTHYENGQVQLAPGDTLIYYTDGFTDAANGAGDRFDEERFTEAFKWACLRHESPQEILEHLFNQVQSFIGDNHQAEDDMTLIVMKVNADEE